MNKKATPPHKILQMEKNNKSVVSLKKAFLHAIDNPDKANKEIVDSLSSQGKLAALNIKELGISSMSLNAMKNACDRTFDGGFNEIDRLRIKARAVYEQHIAKSDVARFGTKTYYIQQITELKKENQSLVDSSIFLASKYYELLHLSQRIVLRASEGKLVPENEERLLKSHLEKFDYKNFGNLRIFDGGKP